MNLTPAEWEFFKKGEIAVRCNTKEKAIDFINKAEKEHGINISVCNKDNTKWEKYGADTIYIMSIMDHINNYNINEDLEDEVVVEWEIDEKENSYFYCIRDINYNIKYYLNLTDKQAELLEWCNSYRINFNNIKINLEKG